MTRYLMFILPSPLKQYVAQQRNTVCMPTLVAQRQPNTARSPTPPRPGHNLGLGQDFLNPPRLKASPANTDRRSQSDGRLSFSTDQNSPWPALS